MPSALNSIKSQKVSILMIAYNNDQYIGEQIESIILQSYPYWQLTISDDGSTDTTLKIAREYALKDARINVISSRQNSGIIENFKKVLSTIVDSEFIALSDGDDVWEKTKLEMQVNYLNAHAHKVLVYHDSKITNEKLVVTHDSLQAKLNGQNKANAKIQSRSDLMSLLHKNMIPAHTMLFRAHLVPSTALIEKKFNIMHDHWIALNATMSGGIGFINEGLVYYRQHTKNVVGSGTRGITFYYEKLKNPKYAIEYTASTAGVIKGLMLLQNITDDKRHKEILSKKIQSSVNAIKIIEAPSLFKTLRLSVHGVFLATKGSNYYYFPVISYWLIQKLIRKFA